MTPPSVPSLIERLQKAADSAHIAPEFSSGEALLRDCLAVLQQQEEEYEAFQRNSNAVNVGLMQKRDDLFKEVNALRHAKEAAEAALRASQPREEPK